MNEEIINNGNDNINNKNNSNYSNNKIKIKPNYIESEIVSNYILEKIISLVISTIFRKEVEKKLPDICYIDLKKMIDDIKDLEFIKHDKDDLIKKKNLLDKISKTPKKEKNKFINLLIPKEDKIILRKNKSQIIREYKLINDLDPNISTNYSINIKPLLPVEKQCFYGLNNEKKVMKILKKKSINEIKNKLNKNRDDPFNEQIENIEKIESDKIENIFLINNSKKNKNIIIMSEIKEPNNWNIIPQPCHSIIDRDASTQVKIDSSLKYYFKVNDVNDIPKKDEKSEEKVNNNLNKSRKSKLENIKRTLRIRNFTFINREEEVKKTKKIVIPEEFPSYDLEPEKTNRIEETDDIKQMRKIIENENKRKLEELKEQQEKERQNLDNNLFNQKKGYFNPNITVDVKGNLVFIKPINIENLIQEFKNMGSHSKEVGRIKDEIIEEKNFKNVKVEVNKNPDNFFEQSEKSTKRPSIARRSSITKTDSKFKNQSKIEKGKEISEISKTPDKSGAKFASGSNFEIMNLECGVNLIENKKKKTGGKNYFQKYGRCSFEIFQDQLNKTTNSYYQKENYSAIKLNINDSDDHIKTEINLPPVKEKKLKREKTDYEIKISENIGKNMLNLKTKNLKAVLSSLDLINEKKFNEFSKTNYENKNWDILKNNNKKENKEKLNLGEINIFNKTLMKNKKWGDPNDCQNPYMTRQNPIKPENLLQKEKSQNKLNNSPRRRLPPINSAIKLFNEQISHTQKAGFHLKKRNKNFKNIKYLNLSKDNLYGNKITNFLATTNDSFHNTEGNISKIKKLDNEK